MEDIQVDPPQKGEVRIRILFTSLCHTDVTFWQDSLKLGLFPRIFGHEASGIVESVGEGVTEFQEGDHVLPVFTGECGDCRYCKSTKSNLCKKFRGDVKRGVMICDNKSRFSVRGKSIYFFMGSTFSEYTVVEQEYVVKVNRAAPLDKLCLLSCGVTTGLGSSWNFAKVEKGSSVAIFGLGTIGLGVAEGAKLSGAAHIIGIDTNPLKFDKARTLGVRECMNPNDFDRPIHEVIIGKTDGGVDYSFECVGSANVVQTALLSCHEGWGKTVVCGVEGGNKTVNSHPQLFLYGRTLTGTLFGGVKPKSELPTLVAMYMNKELQLDQYITHTLPFPQINEAFEFLLQGKSLRSWECYNIANSVVNAHFVHGLWKRQSIALGSND
ncbi:hypothetical protein GOP47_0022742 [Adiantum capillus-veneris]|uniref:Alcohol dehydrogenase 1 n=1 Tax=Adiantum capillus-veneris TaxID=13818 RepID=A0A9D4U659_ADICA|nr:hypothetical protein GOP47_0022742 [Adiantum capillus-veneris]